MYTVLRLLKRVHCAAYITSAFAKSDNHGSYTLNRDDHSPVELIPWSTCSRKMKRRVMSFRVDQVNESQTVPCSPTAIYDDCNRFFAPDLEMENTNIVQASPVDRVSLSN
jgi:hypothetical protein